MYKTTSTVTCKSLTQLVLSYLWMQSA